MAAFSTGFNIGKGLFLTLEERITMET